MHFFHHHNKKDRITEDNNLLQRRVNELDAENLNLRGGQVKEEIIIREDIAKNAHLMNAPVSGGTEVIEETVSIKRRSASASANDLALGETDAYTLRAGQTSRIVSAAAAAQGGAGSSCALATDASAASSAPIITCGSTATTVRRIISTEPPRIIRAEIIRPEKHIMSETACTTGTAAKDGDIVEEIDMRRESLDAKTGDLIEEELTILALEREAPKKQRPQVKTETHVNYVPMGRPKAHDRGSPAPASEVVDHLNNKLEFQVDANEMGSSNTPLHKAQAFPLSDSMTKLPKGLDADKARLKTFERDVELSHQERLVKRNAIVDGVLNSGGQETFEEELEYQKIVHQL